MERFSINNFNCLAALSAMTTLKLRKLSRVWLYTQYLRVSKVCASAVIGLDEERDGFNRDVESNFMLYEPDATF
jgi:hypothetical protein